MSPGRERPGLHSVVGRPSRPPPLVERTLTWFFAEHGLESVAVPAPRADHTAGRPHRGGPAAPAGSGSPAETYVECRVAPGRSKGQEPCPLISNGQGCRPFGGQEKNNVSACSIAWSFVASLEYL
ncbi:hypothetical protein GCM10018965_091510 [Nonomuraea roseola]